MTKDLLPEGFKDDVSSQVATEHKYQNIILDHFQSYGYELIKTPLVEFANIDEEYNSFRIKVKDKEKELTIREDITPQITRLTLSRLKEKPRPLKLCYYGEVLRKKGTMLRPERQFLQIGAECIGENNFLADVEMMDIAFSSLSLIGISNITVEVSSRVFLDKLYNLLEIDKNLIKIKKLIKQKDLEGALSLIDTKHHDYLKNIFSCTGDFFMKKDEIDKLKIDKRNSIEIENIKKIISYFINKNKDVKIFLDLCEVDQNNYYNGFRYIMFADNVRGEIARGGRYIAKNSNKEENATGFTCYMDTILRASSQKTVHKKIMTPYLTKKSIQTKLIEEGYTLLTHFGDENNTKIRAIEQNCQYYLENNNLKTI